MNTYTHFLWAVVLSRWILLSQNASNEGPSESKQACCPGIPRPPGFDLWGALFGSVLPDLFLIATTVVCFVHDYFYGGGSWTSKLFNVWYFENPWIIAGHNLFHSPVSLVLQLVGVYLWHAWWHRPRKSSRRRRDSDGMLPEEQQLDAEAAVPSVTATASDALPLASTKVNLRSSWCGDASSTSPCASSRTCCRCCSCCQCCACCLGWGTSRFWYWALVSALFHALCDIPVHHDDGPLLFWPVQRTYRYEAPFSYWDPKYYGVPISIAEHVLDAVIVVWLVYLFCKSCRPWRWCQRRGRTSSHGAASAPIDDDEMQVMVVENTAATNGYNDEDTAMGMEVLEHGRVTKLPETTTTATTTTATTTIRKNRIIASTSSEPKGKALD